MDTTKVIKKPIVSEKSQALQALGKYVFRIVSDATKRDVEKAVEALYKGTEVGRVAIAKTAGKKVFWRTKRARQEGHRSSIKKAIVTLKKGKIELESATDKKKHE